MNPDLVLDCPDCGFQSDDPNEYMGHCDQWHLARRRVTDADVVAALRQLRTEDWAAAADIWTDNAA